MNTETTSLNRQICLFDNLQYVYMILYPSKVDVINDSCFLASLNSLIWIFHYFSAIKLPELKYERFLQDPVIYQYYQATQPPTAGTPKEWFLPKPFLKSDCFDIGHQGTHADCDRVSWLVLSWWNEVIPWCSVCIFTILNWMIVMTPKPRIQLCSYFLIIKCPICIQCLSS